MQTIADFLKGLPEKDYETELAAPLVEELKKAGMPPEETKFFKRNRDELKLTQLGRNSVPACLIGKLWDSATPREKADSSARLRAPDFPRLSLNSDPGAVDFDVRAGAQGIARSESEPPTVPVRLGLDWGTAPRADVHARNADMVYRLYGRGTDSMIDHATDEGEKSGLARALRLSKAPLDLGLAWTGSLFKHEMGHFEHAWMAGADGTAWVKHPGDYAFGRVVQIPEDEWGDMSPSQRQAFTAGGVNATQAAARLLRTSMLEKDAVDWTYLPQFIMDKADFTLYALNAPRPSEVGPLDDANDMVNYARRYAQRSGRDPDEVHKDLVRGAVWNALDPMNVMAIYGYGFKYLIQGEKSMPNPMVKIGEREYMAGTEFHLSEVGPMYGLNLLSRDPRDGSLVEVAPSMGDRGQWGLRGALSNLPVSDGIRGRVGLEVWNQREAAEESAKRWGGSASAGLDVRLGKKVGLGFEGGWKTEGASLGKGIDEGPFMRAGLNIDF